MARSSSTREFCRLVVIWLNVTASSPHSSFEKRSIRREKSPRPTASALSRNSRSGRVTRRMKNQTTSALKTMPAMLSPNTRKRVVFSASSRCSFEDSSTKWKPGDQAVRP